MTVPGAAAIAAYRPELRASVVLSEALLHGPDTVHLVKDTASGQSFKLGVKEHFLVSRMDGSHSLAEIGAQYAAEFGRRLGDAHWQRLLQMLGARGLLVGSPEPAPAPPGPAAAAPVERGLLKGTLPLVADADATAARLHGVLGFLLAPRWIVPLLALVVAMEVVLALHAGELTVAAWELFTNPVLLAATGALLWASTALHELAHGVVARHYGGKVTEIGLRWRLPVVIMYCTVDNYLYLRSRGGRIATALAGAVMNLVFLLPFCALWLFAPLDDATRAGLAGLLFLGSVQALAMLIPVPPLDGYKVVSQALRATELAASSREFLKLKRRRDPAAAAYPRRARIAYTAYGIGWPLALCLPLAALAAAAHHLLTR